jgi:flagellar protein FlaI
MSKQDISDEERGEEQEAGAEAMEMPPADTDSESVTDSVDTNGVSDESQSVDEEPNSEAGDGEDSNLPANRVTVDGRVDEDDFFTNADGTQTIADHGDIEAIIPDEKKPYLEELSRYWVNKPYAFIVIYRNTRNSEYEYYVIEPVLNDYEERVVDYFNDALLNYIDWDDISADSTVEDKAETVRNQTLKLMNRYNLISRETLAGGANSLTGRIRQKTVDVLENYVARADTDAGSGIPQPDEDGEGKLNEEQIERIIYYLARDFIRYGPIDPIKFDSQVEDISYGGYGKSIFVAHSGVGDNITTNITFEDDEVDDFVQTLAQRAGEGISNRNPSTDATLPDGSRAQLTLGTEVSEDGTNFTIRQFKEVPFTPVDLANWETFSIEALAYLWLLIEDGRSMIFAGGTASGKTTSLNAMALFVPATDKVVSIEDTAELEFPHQNSVRSITRTSSGADDGASINEYDLLEDALRQRPDYVVMGEVRGGEGRDMFQMMNTGHTTFTTFHASDTTQVVNRFTTAPIDVEPSMFEALDVVSIQREVKKGGKSVRRNMSIHEITSYHPQRKEFDGLRTHEWLPGTDTHRNRQGSELLAEIASNKGWTQQRMFLELMQRRMVLSYLISKGINSYRAVAATLQGYMRDPQSILSLIAKEDLESRVNTLTNMENIEIDVDEEAEAAVPRPTPPAEVQQEARSILNRGATVLSQYENMDVTLAQPLENYDVEDSPDSEEETPAIETGYDNGDGGIADADDFQALFNDEDMDAKLDELFEADEDQEDSISTDSGGDGGGFGQIQVGGDLEESAFNWGGDVEPNDGDEPVEKPENGGDDEEPQDDLDPDIEDGELELSDPTWVDSEEPDEPTDQTDETGREGDK